MNFESLLLTCFVIALVVLGLVALASLTVVYRALHKQDQNLIRSQEMVERLTKLAASKDIAAFHALQAPVESSVAFSDPIPMDDESVARRMMDMYSERGIDPSLAVAQDFDILEDFGGTSAVFGAQD